MIVKNFKMNEQNVTNCLVDGNLALKQQGLIEYGKPKIKKLIIKKPTRKVFMGCWQSSNDENGGDGC